LQLSYSKSSECFTVTATTAVAAWVWLDYPDGAVVSFDSNAFWLAPGEARQVTYKVKNDTTNGAWIDGVTVQSMWNQTLPY
jgi:beta-mannosidase